MTTHAERFVILQEVRECSACDNRERILEIYGRLVGDTPLDATDLKEW